MWHSYSEGYLFHKGNSHRSNSFEFKCYGILQLENEHFLNFHNYSERNEYIKLDGAKSRKTATLPSVSSFALHLRNLKVTGP